MKNYTSIDGIVWSTFFTFYLSRNKFENIPNYWLQKLLTNKYQCSYYLPNLHLI